MNEIEKQIEKIKFQLKSISDTLDFKKYPIEYLVINLNWDENDLKIANDIFEEYDNKLQASEDINWTEFELKIRNQFEISYQTVKIIILAFYGNHQWVDVCKGYADCHDVSEFREINRSMN